MRDPGAKRTAVVPLHGDRQLSLDALYRRYAEWLGRTMATRLRSSGIEVDDIVQETYLRAARYSADDVIRQPKALLLRIAVNLARDHMRRNVVRSGATPDDGAVFETLASPPDQHALLQMKRVILDLPPKYRDVFVLSRFTGLTHEEIASHIGISVKTVEWRIGRALAMCATAMRD